MREEKYIRVDTADELMKTVIRSEDMVNQEYVFRRVFDGVKFYTPAEIMAQQWVPVTERLPRPGERVLVCLASSIAIEGYLTTLGTWERHGMTIAGLYGRDVTHWMPLPQPPEEPQGPEAPPTHTHTHMARPRTLTG